MGLLEKGMIERCEDMNASVCDPFVKMKQRELCCISLKDKGVKKMKMTLEEAKNCLDPKFHACKNCKFNDQGEFDCRGTALEIGASALNFLLLGNKLAMEEEEKER